MSARGARMSRCSQGAVAPGTESCRCRPAPPRSGRYTFHNLHAVGGRHALLARALPQQVAAVEAMSEVEATADACEVLRKVCTGCWVISLLLSRMAAGRPPLLLLLLFLLLRTPACSSPSHCCSSSLTSTARPSRMPWRVGAQTPTAVARAAMCQRGIRVTSMPGSPTQVGVQQGAEYVC